MYIYPASGVYAGHQVYCRALGVREGVAVCPEERRKSVILFSHIAVYA